MRALRQTLEIARQTLLLQLRSRFTLLLGGALVVAVAIAVLVSSRGGPHVRGDHLHAMFTYGMFFAFALPFLLLYLGVSTTHGDIEDRTATYLFVRPIQRWSLLLGKWIATVLIGLAVSALGMIAVYAVFAARTNYANGVQPDAGMLVTFLQAAALAVPGYAAVGVACGAIFKRPLVSGFGFLVISEYILSNLPPQAGVRSATIADPIRRWLLQALQPTGDLQDMLLGSLQGFDVDPAKMADPLPSLLKFTLFMLGIGLLVYCRREYDSRPRE